VQHAHRSKLLGKNFLAVHVNYLAPGDAALLGKHKTSVAHCPRSHAYFAHQKFPLEELTEENVNVCLGTDSLVTVKKTPRQAVRLNMFDEMRAFASANPGVTPDKILEMATVNGARALGKTREIGQLSRRSLADIITIPHDGKFSEASEAMLNFTGEVHASMIDGEWAIEPKN
jgi:cytosine/adenosine deaminase-related metal-dependent hydrolase